jgi:hypothetical protein
MLSDPSPSQQDIVLTRNIVEACRHLNIAVHDHVIMGANGHRGQGNGVVQEAFLRLKPPTDFATRHTPSSQESPT